MSDETPTAITAPSITNAAGVPTYDEMEDLLGKRKPNEKSCRILLDPTVKHEIEALETEYNKALAKESKEQRQGKRLNSSTSKAIAEIQEKLEAAYARMEEVTQTFIFRDIGNKAYDRGLSMEENRPTKEQVAAWREAEMDKELGPLLYNTDNFPVWLISKCSAKPKISMEQARVIVEEWGEGDVQTLFMTAIAACKERTSIPFGRRDFATIPDSDLKSLSAETPESPTPSS